MSGSLTRVELPATPRSSVRGRLLTPLAVGGTRHESDGLVAVDAAGGITFAGAVADRPPISPTRRSTSGRGS